jgi:putative heme degradation protein
MKKFFVLVLAAAFLFPMAVQAQEGAKFGPFTALKLDKQVVEDLLVNGDNIYIKVAKDSWSASFTVKISNKNGAEYRKWADDKPEMVVKVYQAPKSDKLGYTYRINTSANYIEYYKDGKLVLQLERMK